MPGGGRPHYADERTVREPGGHQPARRTGRGPGFDTIGDGLWWFGTEVGVVTAFLGEDRPGPLRPGGQHTNCGLTTTDADSSVTGDGLTLIMTQNLTPNFGIWLQYVPPTRSWPPRSTNWPPAFLSKSRLGGKGTDADWPLPGASQPTTRFPRRSCWNRTTGSRSRTPCKSHQCPGGHGREFAVRQRPHHRHRRHSRPAEILAGG